jgi:hypothetical protein
MDSSTLSLQFSFILLGQTVVVDPDGWAREERYTQPVRQIYKTLRKFWPDVPLRLEIGHEADGEEEEGWSIRPNQSLESGDRQSDGLSDDERARLGKGVWVCFFFHIKLPERESY